MNANSPTPKSRESVLQVAIRRMQIAFLRESHQRTAPLRHALAALEANAVTEWPLVHSTAHNFAGLGGSINLPELSITARTLEQQVKGWSTGRIVAGAEREDVRAHIVAVLQCVTDACETHAGSRAP